MLNRPFRSTCYHPWFLKGFVLLSLNFCMWCFVFRRFSGFRHCTVSLFSTDEFEYPFCIFRLFCLDFGPNRGWYVRFKSFYNPPKYVYFWFSWCKSSVIVCIPLIYVFSYFFVRHIKNLKVYTPLRLSNTPTV